MARFFKIAVSVALLSLLLYTLDITRIVDSVREAKWWVIPLAVTLQLLLFSLANVRWWVLLNYHACGYRPATLLAPYFIGIFFNNVLPTTLGGSLFRMYYIYRDKHGAVVAVAPIITERLLGLVAMIATAAVIVPFLSGEYTYVRVLANTLPWLLAFAIVALALIGSRRTYLQRIPVEGKFGQGKNGYNLNYIRAKRADTSFAWINSIFLVMNLLILIRIFFVLCKRGVAVVRMSLLQAVERLVRYQPAHNTRRRGYLYQMATY